MNSKSKEHWQNVYQNKKPNETSWFQEQPTVSLNLIRKTNLDHEQSIIDIGGGASILVDKLFDEGFKNLTVVDISEKALDYAKERLGKQSQGITWIAADITEHNFQEQYHLWHDRAVFHFMIGKEAKERYKQNLNEALLIGGYLIIATFALDGPNKCSGLEVERYDTKKLQIELGAQFSLLQSIENEHQTPLGTKQKFTYCLFVKVSI